MKAFILFIFLFISLALSSQVYERYVVEEIEIKYPHRLEVVWENDVFFQTDRYFTNGIQIEYHSQNLGYSALSQLLLNPMSGSVPVYSLTVTHDIFTPRNVLGDPASTDRPYAGVLLIGLKAVYFGTQKNFRLTSEVQMGLLGKYAGGQLVQNGIHKLLPASEPIPGWTFQIDHDLLLSYNMEIEKLLFDAGWLEQDILARGRLGLPFTDFSGGTRLRFGKAADYYSPDHLLSKTISQFYFFTEAWLRMVMYDATLQGGAFNDNSPHTLSNIKPFLGEIKTGVAFRYTNLFAEIGAQMVTSKFEGALDHRWVYFKVGTLF